MKKQFLQLSVRIGLMLVVALTVVSSSAKGQSLQYGLTVNIPFEFSVGAKKFPAGKYSFKRANQESGDLLVHIQSVDGKMNILPMTFPVEKTEVDGKGTIVFHRYGSDYFLSEMWAAGSTTGRAIPRSVIERELRDRLRESGETSRTERGGTVIIEITGP